MRIVPREFQYTSIITKIEKHSARHPPFLFFGFFFFTPPPLADGVGIAPDGDIAGAAAVSACETFSPTYDDNCVGVDSTTVRRFCIFSINDRFKVSNLLRNMEEYVLNLIQLVLSVIFNTSFPSDAFHLTQYRVFTGDFAYRASAAS